MTSKELINKTFDKTIKRLQKDEMIEVRCSGKQKGMSMMAISMNQVVNDELVKKTDKNITKICKDEVGWNNSGMRRVSEALKAPLKGSKNEH